MVLIDLFTWWYSTGWMHVPASAKLLLARIYHMLSVRQMLGTLFAPWKEDRMDAGRGLDQMMRALVMNTVARFIGFVIRSIFILVWLVLSGLVIVIAALLFIIWPLIPVAPIGGIIWGLTP